MKTLIIDRKRWLRGEGSSASALQRQNDGKRCCLGEHALQCGVAEKDIVGQKALVDIGKTLDGEDIINRFDGLVRCFGGMLTNTRLAYILMGLNDIVLGKELVIDYPEFEEPDKKVVLASEEQREALLIKYFRMAGVNASFVN